jgi:hypothetical protein
VGVGRLGGCTLEVVLVVSVGLQAQKRVGEDDDEVRPSLGLDGQPRS